MTAAEDDESLFYAVKYGAAAYVRKTVAPGVWLRRHIENGVFWLQGVKITLWAV